MDTPGLAMDGPGVWQLRIRIPGCACIRIAHAQGPDVGVAVAAAGQVSGWVICSPAGFKPTGTFPHAMPLALGDQHTYGANWCLMRLGDQSSGLADVSGLNTHTHAPRFNTHNDACGANW